MATVEPIEYASPDTTPRNGLATASLVVGVVGAVVPFAGGLVAVAFGIAALRRPHRHRAARAGIVLGIVGTVLWAGFFALLPVLNRARENGGGATAICKSNLRQIGQALVIYANENYCPMPPDLGTLAQNEGLYISVFVCPSSATTPPASQPASVVDWVNKNSDYVYLGAGKAISGNPKEILVYDKLTNHSGDGMHILFADGHVEWVDRVQAVALVQKQTGHGP